MFKDEFLIIVSFFPLSFFSSLYFKLFMKYAFFSPQFFTSLKLFIKRIGWLCVKKNCSVSLHLHVSPILLIVLIDFVFFMVEREEEEEESNNFF